MEEKQAKKELFVNDEWNKSYLQALLDNMSITDLKRVIDLALAHKEIVDAEGDFLDYIDEIANRP